MAVGDRVWLTPDPYLGRLPGQAWQVRDVEPGHALVLEQRPPENPRPGTWSLMLERAGDGRTRLLSRHCTPRASGIAAAAAARFWSLSSVMERRMMLGVKERAERTSADPPRRRRRVPVD